MNKLSWAVTRDTNKWWMTQIVTPSPIHLPGNHHTMLTFWCHQVGRPRQTGTAVTAAARDGTGTGTTVCPETRKCWHRVGFDAGPRVMPMVSIDWWADSGLWEPWLTVEWVLDFLLVDRFCSCLTMTVNSLVREVIYFFGLLRVSDAYSNDRYYVFVSLLRVSHAYIKDR